MIIEFEQWADEVRALVDERDAYGSGIVEVIERAGFEMDRSNALASIAALEAAGWRVFAAQESSFALGHHGLEGPQRVPTNRQLIVITQRPAPRPLLNPQFAALAELLGRNVEASSWNDLMNSAIAMKGDLASARKRIVDLNAELADTQHKLGSSNLELDTTRRSVNRLAESYGTARLRDGWLWRHDAQGWHADASDATVAWTPDANHERTTSYGTTDYGAGGPDDVHEAVRQRNVLDASLKNMQRTLIVNARNTPETRERIKKFLASNLSGMLILEADEKAECVAIDMRASEKVEVDVDVETTQLDTRGSSLRGAFMSLYNFDDEQRISMPPGAFMRFQGVTPQAGIVAMRVNQENALARYLAESYDKQERSRIALHVHDEIIVDPAKLKIDVHTKAAFDALERAVVGLRKLGEAAAAAWAQLITSLNAWADAATRTLEAPDPATAQASNCRCVVVPDEQSASTTEARALADEAPKSITFGAEIDYRGTESGRVRTRVCGKRHPARDVACKLGYQHTGTCTDGKVAWFDTADGKAPQCMHTLVDSAVQTECQLARDHYGDHVDQNERRWSNKLNGAPERTTTRVMLNGGTVVGPYHKDYVTARECMEVLNRIDGISAHVDPHDQSRVIISEDRPGAIEQILNSHARGKLVAGVDLGGKDASGIVIARQSSDGSLSIVERSACDRALLASMGLEDDHPHLDPQRIAAEREAADARNEMPATYHADAAKLFLSIVGATDTKARRDADLQRELMRDDDCTCTPQDIATASPDPRCPDHGCPDTRDDGLDW